jgi:RNA polymerase sigma factor (TIGR02999 family)
MANQDWGSVGGPANFFAYAATAMRNIVIDRARHRLAQKSGGAWLRVTLSDHGHESEADDLAMDVLVLNDALERLAKEDARAARVVELRYFAGLQVEQIADLMGLNRRTITRDWDFAKAFLRSVIDK